MDKEKVIYSLCVEDILTVIEDNDMTIELNEEDIKFIEDKIGDIIDWRGAIEFALSEIDKPNKTDFYNLNSKRALFFGHCLFCLTHCLLGCYGFDG